MSTATEPRDDVQPVSNETADRIATGLVTALPIIALLVVGMQVWNRWLHWHDVIVFVIMYVPTSLGITVGFHRHFTHRSFKAKPWVRGTLAICGTMAIEGPIVAWVADHRKHHTFSDQEGDPHSPHVDHGHGLRGALKGLLHAHVGWLFVHDQRALKTRYAPDLMADPLIMWVNDTMVYWIAAGLVIPFFLGWAIGGSLVAGLTGMLWGGLVRMFVLHHVTYSINSLCHFFGPAPFDSGDHSRNLAWLAPFSMGEAWHNNHHAFPTSAEHGLRWYQVDFSAMVITALEKTGQAWDVVRVPRDRQTAKLRA